MGTSSEENKNKKILAKNESSKGHILPYSKYFTYFGLLLLLYLWIEIFIDSRAEKHIEGWNSSTPSRFFYLILSCSIIILFLLWMRNKGEAGIKSTLNYFQTRKKSKQENISFSVNTKRVWTLKRVILFILVLVFFNIVLPLFPDDLMSWNKYNSLDNLILYIQEIVFTTDYTNWIWILLFISFIIITGALMVLITDIGIRLILLFDVFEEELGKTDSSLEIFHEDNFMGFGHVVRINSALILTTIALGFIAIIPLIIEIFFSTSQQLKVEVIFAFLLILFVFILGVILFSVQNTVSKRMMKTKKDLMKEISNRIEKNLKQDSLQQRRSVRILRKTTSFNKFYDDLYLRNQLSNVNDRPFRKSMLIFVGTQFITLIIGIIIWLLDKFIQFI